MMSFCELNNIHPSIRFSQRSGIRRKSRNRKSAAFPLARLPKMAIAEAYDPLKVVLPCSLAFAHLALAIADNFAFAAALILRRPFVGTCADSPRCFAHRALCAAAILARAAVLIVRAPCFFGASTDGADESKILDSSALSFSIWPLISAARRSCSAERLEMFMHRFIGEWTQKSSRLQRSGEQSNFHVLNF